MKKARINISNSEVIDYGFHATPFGLALIGATGAKVCFLSFVREQTKSQELAELKKLWPNAELNENKIETGKLIKTIFLKSGSRSTNIKLLTTGTPFQIKVWEALLKIPAGSVASYGDIAKKIGKPKASRAVGSAVAKNHIAVLIPCHRVIRNNGKLGEFHWGPKMKRDLLDWEAS